MATVRSILYFPPLYRVHLNSLKYAQISRLLLLIVPLSLSLPLDNDILGRKPAYSSNVAPPQPIPASFSISPLCFNIDERGVLSGQAWERWTWEDPRLAYDKETVGDDVIRVDASTVWVPDITLYNTKNTGGPMFPWKTKGSNGNVLIYPPGNALFVPTTEVEAICNDADLDLGPWAKQKCTLTYGSWTYSEARINITQYQSNEDPLSEYWDNCESKIVSFNVVRESKTYPCCPDEKYVSLKFKMVLERQYMVTESGVLWNPNLDSSEEGDSSSSSSSEESSEEGEKEDKKDDNNGGEEMEEEEEAVEGDADANDEE